MPQDSTHPDRPSGLNEHLVGRKRVPCLMKINFLISPTLFVEQLDVDIDNSWRALAPPMFVVRAPSRDPN